MTASESKDWDEYWDYENTRVLFFKKSSMVPSEHEGGEGDVLLREGILRWCSSRDDEEGFARPSRAIWKADYGEVSHISGAIFAMFIIGT